MRLASLALLALLAAAGCARFASDPSTGDGGGRPAAGALTPPSAAPPRPRESSGPETVGASELGALEVVRPTALRQEPASGAPRFGALKVGDLVLRLDARGPWLRVWLPSVGMSGWIEKGSVGPGRPVRAAVAGPVPVTELRLVSVSRTGARLRSGPSPRAAIVRSLERGEPLRLVRQEGTWLKVFDPATRGTGYISAQLVERAR